MSASLGQGWPTPKICQTGNVRLPVHSEGTLQNIIHLAFLIDWHPVSLPVTSWSLFHANDVGNGRRCRPISAAAAFPGEGGRDRSGLDPQRPSAVSLPAGHDSTHPFPLLWFCKRHRLAVRAR